MPDFLLQFVLEMWIFFTGWYIFSVTEVCAVSIIHWYEGQYLYINRSSDSQLLFHLFQVCGHIEGIMHEINL
jgi:hypothetical protein